MSSNKIIVGQRIKTIREQKGISLEQLSERSGLDVTQIERIEVEPNIPSLAPLIKISRALGIRLGTLLDDNEALGPVVTGADNCRRSVSFSTTQASSHTHIDYFSLAPDKSGRHIEPFIIQVAPRNDGQEYQLSQHEGEEFIYCLSGAIEITYGSATYTLSEGDSIYYDSIVQHHVHAADERGAKALAVVYQP